MFSEFGIKMARWSGVGVCVAHPNLRSCAHV